MHFGSHTLQSCFTKKSSESRSPLFDKWWMVPYTIISTFFFPLKFHTQPSLYMLCVRTSITKTHFLFFHRTSINYLLMNLAIADMVLAIFFVPRHLLVHTFRHPDGVAGTLVCKLLTGGNLAWVGGTASIVTLIAIATERYFTVVYPLGNRSTLTNGRLKVRKGASLSVSS